MNHSTSPFANRALLVQKPKQTQPMRFLVSLLFLLFLLQDATAQVITRLSGGTSYFSYNVNDLATIVINASENDTIILPGGPINCTGITVNKPLTFIGAGVLNAGTAVTLPTVIPYAYNQDIVIASAGSGTRFHGINFDRVVRFTGGVSNVSFMRCAFAGFTLAGYQQVPPSNLNIKHCIFRSGIGNGSYTAPQGLLVENSIIAGGINIGSIATAQIIQCIILNMTNNNGVNQGVVFSNNIFTRSSGSFSLNSASTYSNNLFAMNGGNTMNWNGAIDGGGNVGFQSTLTNVFFNLGSYTTYDESYDYHLVQGSIGLTMGSTGQVGIYGGPLGSPWKEGAIPFNPHWVSLQPSLGSTNGGTINVTFSGAAQQN